MGAIPKKVLIHTATLKGEVVKDVWGNIISSNDISLTNIRIDATNKLVQTTDNQERQLTAVIFYDCTNSRPKDVVFLKDQPIYFNDSEHRINAILPVYDGKKLHHYEVEVI